MPAFHYFLSFLSFFSGFSSFFSPESVTVISGVVPVWGLFKAISFGCVFLKKSLGDLPLRHLGCLLGSLLRHDVFEEWNRLLFWEIASFKFVGLDLLMLNVLIGRDQKICLRLERCLYRFVLCLTEQLK